MRWRPIKFLCLLGGLMATSAGVKAQNDSLFLSLPQLFERGSREHLRLAADRLKEEIAQEKARTARTARLPEMTVGLKGGYLGQPIVWQHGLSDPTRPESPDWQQSYAFDFSQPVYQGGRIRYAIRQADLAQELAVLQTAADQADIKLALLEQYLDLFSLYKQCRVLQRNIEESEQRLRNIRRLCEEGVITNNDVLRSEMQLTDNRLSLSETQNNIRLVSQQLDILLGLDESLLLVPDTTLLSQDCPVATYSEYVDRAYEAEPSMLLLQKQTEMARNQILGIDNVSKGIFPAIGDYFNHNQELLPGPGYQHGFFYSLVEGSQQVGERPTAAFPSSHVGISTILMIMAWRGSKKLFACLIPFYMLLCGATVYIQAHYVIDAIVGFFSAFLLYVVVTWMFKKWFAQPMFK